jgi:acetyltransferase
MDKFFYPESVAVVGVSSSATNLARQILENLVRFRYQGRVYAVGSRRDEIDGFTVYASVLEIEEPVDLAILLVPAKTVPAVVEECGQKGVRNVIVESGGFRELDGEGSDAEHRLLQVCRKWGIRMIGPNCMGVINQENGLCSPFADYVSPFFPGGLSVLSQSGGVGMSFAMDLNADSIGLNKFISYGNGLDIDEVELLDYLGQDEGTRIISAYVEGITRGRDFLRVISRMDKPVVVLKSNTTRASRPVAASHSAMLSGDEDVLNAAFRQVGVLRVPNSLVWANVSKQLTLPLMQGNRLAILSRSGGHAVLAADTAHKFGFELVRFPQAFYDACRQFFANSVVNLQNPLDLGQIFYPPVLAHILEETLRLDEVDGVLFIHTYRRGENDELAHQLIGQIMPLIQKYNKPVSTVLFTDPDEQAFVGSTYRLPCFATPYHGVQALAYSRDALRLAERRRPFDENEGESAPEDAKALVEKLAANGRRTSMRDAYALMAAYGVPLAPHRFVTAKDDLPTTAAELGYPLALKLDHPSALHKSDIGGVVLDIRTDQELLAAWENIRRAATEHGLGEDAIEALVQKMAPRGYELFVGGKRDVSFGPVVLAGMGGVLTEVIRDIGCRVAPVTAADASEMLEETRAARLLDGHRGQGPADSYALIELILTVSRLLLDCPQIDQIDLNPVVVHPAGKGLTVLDARIVLSND